ncbi:MAG: hypothetical protein P8J27_04740 [Mariniblastus sp.]|nr:hypothetical protein [Mariniblastus sp.]
MEQAKPLPLYWRMTSWLWPTQRDGLLIQCSLLILIGLIDPIVEQYVFLFQGEISDGMTWSGIAGMVGTVLGVAASFGWKNGRWDSAKVAFIGTVLGGLALSYSSYLAWNGYVSDVSLFVPHEVQPIVIGDRAFVFWLIFVIGMLLAGLVIFCFARAVLLLTGLIQARNRSWSITRPKLLAGIGLILILIGTVQNIFFPQGFLFAIDAMNTAKGIGGYVFRAVIVLIGVGILGIASWGFSSGNRLFRKYAIFCLVCVASIVWACSFVTLGQTVQSHDFSVRLAIVTGLNMFLLTSITVGGGGETALGSVAKGTFFIGFSCHPGPSIWASFVGFSVLCFVVIISFFDPIPLVQSAGTAWESARFVRFVKSESNRQLTVVTDEPWAYQLRCDFNEGVDPGVFGEIQIPRLSLLSIENMVPEIKTEVFGGVVQEVMISNSKVSTTQLSQLLRAPRFVMLSNVEVVDPEAELDLSATTLHLQFDEGNSPQSLLRSIRSVKNVFPVLTCSQDCLEEEALDEIVRFSQRVQVLLGGAVLERMVASGYSSGMSMKNLVIQFNPALIDGDSDELQRYILQNDVSLIFNSQGMVRAERPRDFSRTAFWDLAFAKGKSGVPDYQEEILASDLSWEGAFQKKAKMLGWQFGQNENGDITHLFLPNGESAFESSTALLEHLVALETLCFDPNWLSGTDPNFKHGSGTRSFNHDNPISMSGFKDLPRLKRLDLTSKVVIDDPDFLRSLPAIEHLQVRFSNSVVERVDFSVCNNLQTLVYFGTPTNSTIRELSGLKDLQSFIVVKADDGLLETPQEVSYLKSILRGVSVEIVSIENFESKPSKRFQQHVKLQSKIARERLDGIVRE